MWASGTKPVAADPGFDSMVRAKLSGDQTIATASWVVIEFDETDYDGLGELDVGNDRILIQADGKYSFTYALTLQQVGAGKEGQVRIDINGGVVAGCCEFVGNASFADNKVNGAFDVELSVGDYVKLQLYHTNAGNRLLYSTSSGGSIFCMRRFA